MAREPNDGGPAGRKATAKAASTHAQVRQMEANLRTLRHKLEKEVAAAAAPELGASHEQIAHALALSRARVTQMIKAVKLDGAAPPAAPRARRPQAATASLQSDRAENVTLKMGEGSGVDLMAPQETVSEAQTEVAKESLWTTSRLAKAVRKLGS